MSDTILAVEVEKNQTVLVTVPDHLVVSTAEREAVVTSGGYQGIQGPQGLQGIQGIQGPQGPQGPVGPQGVSITDAEVDPSGNLQVTTTAGTINAGSVIGPQGPQGIQGPQGPQGIQGVSVIDAVVDEAGNLQITTTTENINAGHVVGPQGPQGIQGPQGQTGPQGPQGIAGDNFIGGYTISITSPTPGDLIQFGMSNQWINSNLTDGGNF